MLADNSNDKTAHRTIFHTLKDNLELPPQEKSVSRLTAEATSIVGAGTFTTAHTLATITTYHLLANPVILEHLISELESSIPDTNHTLDLQSLEQLPYLTAVVHEGLRISHGVLYRLSRVHPNSTLQFQEWIILLGTPVGMSPIFLHKDKVMFPRPRNFEPRRWIEASREQHEAMIKRLSNFGHGSRQCVGMNLAYAELYPTLSCVFRRLGRKLELYDMQRECDVDLVRDYFIPAPSVHSRGVRVVSKK